MLGRIEDGRIRFNPVELDLAAVCAQIVDEVVSATGAVGRIALRVEPGLPRAHADPDLLRHVLGNLLGNAVKYSPEGSPVRLDLGRVDGDARFIVEDHGIGIPPGDRGALFEAFSRGSNVGARPGTGLGLLIVKRCVETHEGTIQVDSELGRGTAVTVRLPVFAIPSRTEPS
jgi:signal transduction histidine kinase